MMSEKFKKKFIFFWLGGLLVTAILIWTAVLAKAQNNGQLAVHFFDIGQGKAIFIQAPDGSQILIDGGPDNSVLRGLSQEMPFYDRDIDLIILTHPDADHLNGLIEVLKRYDVGQIIETGIIDKSPEYSQWQKLIKEKNIVVSYVVGGEKIKSESGFILKILYPNRDLSGQSFANTNITSIVSRLDYGQSSFLFTGDEEGVTEAFLVGSGADIDADILDVSHHGSKNSTGQDFVEAVSPEVAVIQAGRDNRYGHPAQETLERLEGIKVLRTDLCGDIIFFSDGENLKTESGCE